MNSVKRSYTGDSEGYDYHPFGMVIEERSKSYQHYRFGFNGMEQDNEVACSGNLLDFGARVYASRLGRWHSVDLEFRRYPSISSFAFSTNSPLVFNDPNGKWIERKTTRYDKDGSVKPLWKIWVKTESIEIHYTVHQAKVYFNHYNALALTEDQKTVAAGMLQSEIEQTLLIENEKLNLGKQMSMSVQFNEPLTVVSDKSELNLKGRRSDNVFYVANFRAIQRANPALQDVPVGYTRPGHNVIVLRDDAAYVGEGEVYEKTAAHELLHTLGIRFHSKMDESIFSARHDDDQEFLLEDAKRLIRPRVINRSVSKRSLLNRIDYHQNKHNERSADRDEFLRQSDADEE